MAKPKRATKKKLPPVKKFDFEKPVKKSVK